MAAVVFCSLIGGGLAPKAQAGDWSFKPQLSFREVFTDNVRLAPGGLEDSDFVTDLSPSLAVRGKSRRLQLDMDYQLEKLIYAEGNARSSINHLLRVDGTGELLTHYLFLDADLRMRPQNVSSTGRNATDNINATTDRAEVLTYDISPYWKQRFGNFSALELRYKFNEVNTGSTLAADSRSHEVRAKLDSGRQFTKLLWSAVFDNENISSSSGTDTTFRNIRGRARYLFTREWGLIGEAGYDDDDFGTSRGNSSGPLWAVGASWTPNRRTSLEATVGERFFGRTVSMNLDYHYRRIHWTASFTEEPSTTRQTLIQQQVFPVLDAFGAPIISPVTGQPVLLNVNVPTQTAEVLISRNFSSTLAYVMRRHRLQAHVFDEERDFQVTAVQETVRGFDAFWDWDLGPKTTSRLTFAWNTQDLAQGRKDDFTLVEWLLTRHLAPELDAVFGARHVTRSSSAPGADYDENRVSAGLTKTF